MMAALFAYGTLEFPEILEIVAGRPFESVRPAFAEGYRRNMLAGRRYPGIRPDASTRTDGVLYLDLDSDAMHRVDRFEGDVYDRREVRVNADGRDEVAYTYVVKSEYSGLLEPSGWDREFFRRTHLADYTRMCRKFAAGLIAQVSEP
jgi:gamma-glutamylcyclotransferase (GGCT)/AIG2-like uncharacterized protein YtfP